MRSEVEISKIKSGIFLLDDLRDLFLDLGSGGRNKENDQLTGHFQSFFLNISRKKTVKL